MHVRKKERKKEEEKRERERERERKKERKTKTKRKRRCLTKGASDWFQPTRLVCFSTAVVVVVVYTPPNELFKSPYVGFLGSV